MGVPSTVGLAPDAPCLPAEWREGSGIGFALAERAAGRPADPLLFALTRHHRRMHDGRRVDADEQLRLATVLVAPQRPAAPTPMREAAPDDEAPAELAPRLKRRSRVAELVPAGKVTGWVPQWKRADDVGANVAAGGDGAGGGGAYLPRRDPQPHGASLLRTLASQPAIAGASTSTPPVEAPASFPTAEIPPQSAPQVVARPPTSDCAPETARSADAPVVIPPAAGAPVAVAGAAPVRQSPPAASTSGKRGCAARQRPAAAPAGDPPRSPAAAGSVGRSAAPAKSAPPRPPRSKQVPSIEHIIAVAERRAGIAPGALVPEARSVAASAARHTALWLAHTLLGWDLTRLGARFGRDRTSVRHSIRVVAERRDRDEAFADELDALVTEAKAEPRTRRRKIAP